MWDFRYIALPIALMHVAYGGPNDENILATLQQRIINLNGEPVQLNTLFEDTLSNADETKLQKLAEITTNKPPIDPPSAPDPNTISTYIDRELVLDSENPRRANPSTITNEIIASTTSLSPPQKKLRLTPTSSSSSTQSIQPSHPSKFVVIKGVTRSGKTSIQNRIFNNLVMTDAAHWIIRTDAADLKTLLSENIDEEKYISHSIKPFDRELFEMLRELNPKKIVIFIDDLEKIQKSTSNIDSFYTTIASLKDEGIRFVINSDESVLKKIKHLSPTVWEIPELNFQETSRFLTVLWQNVPQRSNKPIPVHIIDQRRQNWVLGVTTVLMELPMPRQPTTLQAIAEMYPPYRHPFYFLNDLPEPLELTYMMDDKRPKKEVYGAIVKRIANGQTDGITNLEYGALAFSNIIRKVEQPHIAAGLLGSIEDHLEPLKNVFKNPNLRPMFVYPSTVKTVRAPPTPNAHPVLPGSGLIQPTVHRVTNEFEFIYNDLENYFAAEFIVDLLKNHQDGDFILQHILSEENYIRILEFVESPANIKATDPTSERLKKIFFSNKFIINKIMDNLLIHGLENLFNRFLCDLYIAEKSDILINYFNQEYKPYISIQRPMGMLRSKEYSDLLDKYDNPNNRIDDEMRTRLELVIENNLVDTFENVDALEIKPKEGIEEYEKLLRYALHRPRINMRISQKIIQYGQSHNYPLNFDNLMFDLIDKQGDVILKATEILHIFKILPATVSSRGEEIFEAAAKWNSRNLLNFIQKTLQVPFTDSSGKFNMKAFARALDSNPCPLYTSPSWWHKMDYLMTKFQTVGFSMQDFYLATTQDADFTISLHDYKSPWLRIILGSDKLDLTIQQPLDAHEIVVNPLKLGEPLSDEQLGKMLLIPSAQWDVNEKTLALRRHFIMEKLFQSGGKDVTFLELFVNYRGVALLNGEERYFYRRLIKNLIQFEKPQLTTQVTERILSTLIDNIGHDNDVKDIQHFLENGLTVPSNEGINILRRRLSTFTLDDEKITAFQRLTSTHSEYMHANQEKSYIEENPNCLEPATPIEPQPSTSSSIIKQCLEKRKRRSITTKNNCLISLQDIEYFNDARTMPSIYDTKINSNKFLKFLSTSPPMKQQQLMHFINELKTSVNQPEIFTGLSQKLLSDVMHHGGLIKYRQYISLKSAMHSLLSPTSNKVSYYFPSKNAIFYGATAIMLIRGLHQTIATCVQQHNDTHDCLYASAGLALAITFPIGIGVAMKYVPWAIHSFSRLALDMLPEMAPHFLHSNIELMGEMGLKYAPKILAHSLIVGSMLVDGYTFLKNLGSLIKCTQQTAGCSSEEKSDLITSLGFSGASILVSVAMLVGAISLVTGAVIGLAIMIGHMIVSGISAGIYYHTHYDTTPGETTRIILHKMFFMQTPVDVAALAHRTDWIEQLRDHAVKLLDESSDNIVAYSVGIGALTQQRISPHFSYIDMTDVGQHNTKNLSRVEPHPSDNSILICLPKLDLQAPYEEWAKTFPSAIYNCWNSFVIAHKKRWMQPKTEKSAIIHNLEFVDTGLVRGSANLNNFFFIHTGTIGFFIYGVGNGTETFIIQTAQFYGTIYLSKNARKNILDLSNIPINKIEFSWDSHMKQGNIEYINNQGSFNVSTTEKNQLPNLHVIGRKDKSDSFTCSWSEQLNNNDSNNFDQSISVDGNGGESHIYMDEIYDCKISVIHPYTVITGSYLASATYLTSITLSGLFYTPEHTALAAIHPLNSSFIISFANRPIFSATHRVEYNLLSNTLAWTFQYSQTMAMKLDITSYLRMPERPSKPSDYSKLAATCMFVDTKSNVTIVPVIDPADSQSSVISVESFTVFGLVDSIKFADVIHYYHQLNAFNKAYKIVTRLVNQKTNYTFLFGSSDADNFYFDQHTIYLAGTNGQDTYSLSEESPERVWINNEAKDQALDILILSKDVCDSLHFEKNSADSPHTDSSSYDVTLICSRGSKTWFIVLSNYLLGPEYRHLAIHWDDSMQTILPEEWMSQDGPNETLHSASLAFFGDQSPATSMILNSQHRYLIVNGTTVDNPLVAYKYKSHAILSSKHVTRDTFAFVVLREFYVDRVSYRISHEWRNFKAFILDPARQNEALFDTLTAERIKHKSLYPDDDLYDNTDLIREYFIDVHNPGNDKNIYIEHNVDSEFHQTYQMGSAIVYNTAPDEFRGYTMGVNLVLEAYDTKIFIKNWCIKPYQRLFSIEFVYNNLIEPIIIDSLDQLDCIGPNNSSISNALEKLFKSANKQLQWVTSNDDSDRARLKRCVGAVLSDLLAKQSMHKLLGFRSVLEKILFVYKNCNDLFALMSHQLKMLTKDEITSVLKHYHEWAKLSHYLTSDDDEKIENLYQNVRLITPGCWHEFMGVLSDKKIGNIRLICLP